MMGAIIMIVMLAIAGLAYYYGIQIGHCEGFNEGMDAAIATYEEALKEDAR